MYPTRPLFLSTYPPEECGLATFTQDSADAVDRAAGEPISAVAAIQKTRTIPNADPRVVHVIDNLRRDAYSFAAMIANEGACDVVSLQHEFGLYPGDWGSHILEFAQGCRKPIVTTFHTLQTHPEQKPRNIVRELCARSQGVIVMTNIASELLRKSYGVSNANVAVIPHGVPEVSFQRPSDSKARLGLEGRKVVCTFGLINRGKGLEHMIQALPAIVESCPEVTYLIVGMTHPVVKRQEGEVYRESLMGLADSLGVGSHVQFVNRYLSLPELLQYLQACDVFITPYPGKDQIASGTMAYALASVGAVVSTPYLYAQEVLAERRGLLVPFADSQAMAQSILSLLTNESLLLETRIRAYQYAKPMFWSNVGQMYLDFFGLVASQARRASSTSYRGPISRIERNPHEDVSTEKREKHATSPAVGAPGSTHRFHGAHPACDLQPPSSRKRIYDGR